jgi:hypothetical protein
VRERLRERERGKKKLTRLREKKIEILFDKYINR